MKKLLSTILILFCAATVNAATYYVRNDGGSASECLGTTDAAYPGSGTGQACAWRSLATGLVYGSVLIQGGDTVIIDNIDEVVGSGQAKYKIMYGGDDIGNSVVGTCSSTNQRACRMAAIPSGSQGSPTKIYGKNWESCDDVTVDNKAELWGGGDQRITFDIENRDYIEIRCLALTDHDQCAENGNWGGAETWNCDRDCSDGTCTGSRIGMSINGSGNILLENVDIYGQSLYNMYAYDINDITFRGCKFISAALSGVETGGTMTGNNVIDKTVVRFGGCTQKYPLATTDLTSSTNEYKCNSASNCGGFGDGWSFSTGASGGNWAITDSEFSYNTSDGWDFLHSPSSNLTVKRSRFEGNAGQQLKANAGNVHIESSKFIGNCDWWSDKTFTNNTDCDGSYSEFQVCRAEGDTVFLNTQTGTSTELINNTIVCKGNLAIGNSRRDQVSSPFNLTNNIIYALEENGGQQCAYYLCCDNYGCSCDAGYPTTTYSVVYDSKNGVPSGTGNVGTNPLFNEATTLDDALYDEDIDVTLQSTSSSAYNIADETANLINDVDYNNWARGVAWDSGAYEVDTEGGATCSTSCVLCEDQSTCEASTASTNCTGNCCWQPIAGQCSVTAEATCDTDCSVCSVVDSGTECAASALPCYWWSTDTCNATEEPDTCDDDCSLCSNQSFCESSSVPCDWSIENIYEDFGTFTEVDSGSDITVETHSATVDTMQKGVVSSLCKSYGDGHFTDFIHEGEITITGRTDGQLISFWTVKNGGSTIYDLAQATSPSYVLSYGTDGGSFSFYIEYFGDPYDYDQYVDESEMPFTRYYRVTRSSTTVTAQIYSDSAKTTLLDTISVTGATTPMENICVVLNNGASGTQSGSLVSSNIKLNEVNQCVAESAATCNTDCTVCLSQGGCEGSAQTCYWWSTDLCKTTEEPSVPATPVSATRSITITGQNLSVSFP